MNSPLTPNEIEKAIKETGTPLAYLEGFAYFYGRKFLVTPDVLIPRPETEDIIHLVENIYDGSMRPKTGDPRRAIWVARWRGTPKKNSSSEEFFWGRKPRQAPNTPATSRFLPCTQILDLGTGSGIIAITIALELKNAKITATDISEKALEVAKKNAKHLNAKNISFKKSNLLDNLKNQKFDIITANLPYVDKTWPWLNKKSLAFEPESALYAEDEGLALIKKCLDQAPAHMKENAHLLLEADPSQHPEIIKYAKKKNLALTTSKGYILDFTLA